MGFNDRMPDLEEAARGAALQAGAIKACPLHPDVALDMGDPEASNRAYAIGARQWKDGHVLCERKDFMDAIKEAIDGSADGCPECEKLRDV